MPRINRDHIHLFLDYGIDISTKTIYMGYGDPDSDVELDHVLTANVLRGLHILGQIRIEDPIEIIMNCQGGDVQHGLALYDAITNCSANVNITVLGHCHSMAAWVLQAGTNRYMTKNSSMMIHDGEGTKSGFAKEQDLRCRNILLDKIKEKHPKFSSKRLQEMLDTDYYMFPEEALELGLIDLIVEGV